MVDCRKMTHVKALLKYGRKESALKKISLYITMGAAVGSVRSKTNLNETKLPSYNHKV